MLMVMFTLETGQMGSSRGKVLTYLVKQSKNFKVFSTLDTQSKEIGIQLLEFTSKVVMKIVSLEALVNGH